MLGFDETADEIDGEMWAHCTKLKLPVHVSVFMHSFDLFPIVACLHRLVLCWWTSSIMPAELSDAALYY